jgi:hypothetical protein
MTPNAFAPALDELKQIVARIVSAIENGGGEVNLRDLRLRLIDLIVLIERDPGITAATADLFDAAAAMVRDGAVHSQPEARKRRLLRDARQRFDERLAGARPLNKNRDSVWQHRDLKLAA